MGNSDKVLMLSVSVAMAVLSPTAVRWVSRACLLLRLEPLRGPSEV